MSLIIISGLARSGKDTLGELMKQKFTENYYTMAYANELKRKCAKDFDLSREQLWGDLKEVEDKRYPKSDGSCWTPREILQHMGTEAYRAVDDKFWIKSLFKYVDRNNLKNVIITDGRFPEEIDAVKERGGVHIKVLRDAAGAAQGKSHASETSLDNYDNSDYIVDNNGTIDDLEDIARQLVKEIENG